MYYHSYHELIMKSCYHLMFDCPTTRATSVSMSTAARFVFGRSPATRPMTIMAELGTKEWEHPAEMLLALPDATGQSTDLDPGKVNPEITELINLDFQWNMGGTSSCQRSTTQNFWSYQIIFRGSHRGSRADHTSLAGFLVAMAMSTTGMVGSRYSIPTRDHVRYQQSMNATNHQWDMQAMTTI